MIPELILERVFHPNHSHITIHDLIKGILPTDAGGVFVEFHFYPASQALPNFPRSTRDAAPPVGGNLSEIHKCLVIKT